LKYKNCKVNFDASKAMNAQKLMSSRLLSLKPVISPSEEKIIVGLDVAYKRASNREYAYGVAVAYDSTNHRIADCIIAVRRVCIPYIPGLLAFREMIVLGPLSLYAKKAWKPDVYFVDGHGVSHPRRLGIASHVGIAVNAPSIGIAKKKLVGRIIGDSVVKDGEVVAKIIRTPTGSTIYVSPGHLVDLETAYRIVVKYLKGRLPEPLLIADRISKAAKKLVDPSEELTYHACPKLLTG